MFWRVFEIRPAIASDPPEGSSTVDLAGRFLRAGMLMLEDDRAFVGELAHLGLDLQADAAFRQHDRREGEADTELLEGDGELAVAVDHGDRELAAGQELGRLARHRGQGGLGQGTHQPIALQRAQRAGDLRVAGVGRVYRGRNCPKLPGAGRYCELR